jgi:hypothetical protein
VLGRWMVARRHDAPEHVEHFPSGVLRRGRAPVATRLEASLGGVSALKPRYTR